MKTKTSSLLLVMIITTITIGLQSNAQENEPKEHSTIEIIPKYPGGNKALLMDISTTVKYPEEALKSNKTGKVYVGFKVNKGGEIAYSHIARGCGPILDKEALITINGLNKKWMTGNSQIELKDTTFYILFDFKKEGKIDVTIPPPRQKK